MLRVLTALVALAWTAFMLWGTLSPLDQLPPLPEWELLSFDTAAHAGIFVVTAVLYVLTARWQRLFPSLRHRAFLWTLVVCLLLGAFIELTQTLMDLGRLGEWTDMISDALGTVAGLAFMHWTRRWWDVLPAAA
ncbi:VanZ family protein [Hymenobacter sp. 15J16-1T3B]|uniref:VanZ family protein n=1 Tax=Hymenobacter sp. 15J16-1T3B TaxID=2886941 RepID=UPI001D12DA67|nr:VanZ family protein [Hymenobacter sp. 15J16-1T3B]MCC3159943.1 VanZ family protein [Hymenobacter sp. 15J16-1T3B]